MSERIRISINLAKGAFEVEAPAGELEMAFEKLRNFASVISEIKVPASAKANEQQETGHESNNKKSEARPAKTNRSMTSPPGSDIEGAKAKLADESSLQPEEIEAALQPQADKPYLSLDSRIWGDFKRVVPSRGRGGIARAALAATLLALWKDAADVDSGWVSKEDVNPLFLSFDNKDKNLDRSLENCDWLNVRGDRVRIKPTDYNSAYAVLRGYCRGERPEMSVED